MLDQSAPSIGATVLTSDDEKVGEVAETLGQFFKVDVSLRPDFWLAMDDIGEMSEGQVRLSFTKKELGDHKRSEPGF